MNNQNTLNKDKKYSTARPYGLHTVSWMYCQLVKMNWDQSAFWGYLIFLKILAAIFPWTCWKYQTVLVRLKSYEFIPGLEKKKGFKELSELIGRYISGANSQHNFCTHVTSHLYRANTHSFLEQYFHTIRLDVHSLLFFHLTHKENHQH